MKYFLIIILIFFSAALSANFAKAATLQDAFTKVDTVAGSDGAGYKTDVELTTIIGTTISVMLSFLGVVFIGLMIYGGYVWMIAKGNEQEVTKAKQTITAAVIGLVIVMSAYAISYFVVSKLTAQTIDITDDVTE